MDFGERDCKTSKLSRDFCGAKGVENTGVLKAE